MKSSGAQTSVRLVLAMAAAVLLGGFGLAAPAVAHVSAQPAADVYWTTGRLVGSVAILVALAGVIIGGLALARPTSRIGTGNGRLGATMALVAGVVGIALGGFVVAAAEGGPGTGYGIVGGYASLVFGLIATVVGGLALARSRRTG